jgi:outer membrane murein-binding lipoprotein Lpp
MGRRIAVMLIAVVLAVGLAGCGAKEREELKQKVASLEQQLASANSQLAEKTAAMTSMEESLKQAHEEAAKCLNERDLLKAELSKKKSVAPKKPVKKKK